MVFGGSFALAALVPPRSSVLPPGAGNEAKKAIELEEKRAKNAEEGYVDEAGGPQRELNAATVARQSDDDVAAIPSFKPTQHALPDATPPRSFIRGVRAV